MHAQSIENFVELLIDDLVPTFDYAVVLFLLHLAQEKNKDA